ncbi:MAG TPA: hypothetical protein HPP87_00390 [Planctomycetes bacterium]|nr:hypothetical protein [Planctomycetota bacterium]
MQYNRLWILVEGNDDEKLVAKIKPVFKEKYDSVTIWKYAQQLHKKTCCFLKSINSMQTSDYLFLKDINQSPCTTEKKEKVKDEYGDIIHLTKVVIVIKEIESWYLAGLDDDACKELRIKTFSNTDNITKENFNKIIPTKYDSRIDFMQEILKRFSIETAKEKNTSLNYFLSKI